jgi:hypothetical protein
MSIKPVTARIEPGHIADDGNARLQMLVAIANVERDAAVTQVGANRAFGVECAFTGAFLPERDAGAQLRREAIDDSAHIIIVLVLQLLERAVLEVFDRATAALLGFVLLQPVADLFADLLRQCCAVFACFLLQLLQCRLADPRLTQTIEQFLEQLLQTVEMQLAQRTACRPRLKAGDHLHRSGILAEELAHLTTAHALPGHHHLEQATELLRCQRRQHLLEHALQLFALFG